MIFVCLGSQSFQFNRLLVEIDRLIENGLIHDYVFAQTGSSDYLPKNFDFKPFLSHDEFKELSDRAELIISHGGTGALINASKKGKNIIAVPRLSKYGEHVDDHQLQIVEALFSQGYIRRVLDISNLGQQINDALSNPIRKKYSNESHIVDILEKYIEEMFSR